ncbi:MAG: chromophore lyase CpcT/CpeT [Phycisphaerales bacterium]
MPRPNTPSHFLARIAAAVAIGATMMLAAQGCASGGRDADAAASGRGEGPHRVMARIMDGHYTSTAQALANPDSFFDIHLHMTPIWTDRAGSGPGEGQTLWVYVEQAAATRLDRPYRQRIYRIDWTAPESVESRVYLLPGDPLAYAGAHEDPSRLDALTPADLIPREGCTVYLRYNQDTRNFTGGTRGNGCESELAGAAYATSTVTMDADTLLTWDRGWSADGEQVWGSTEGPYEFRRIGR